MGRKALEVGDPSRAASNVFEGIRVQRGISKKDLKISTGMKAQPRFLGLLNGTAIWMLEDVEMFAIALKIPLRIAFSDIIKELNRLTNEANCPCNEESLAG